jgi:M6 family metalloprotease-like protein
MKKFIIIILMFVISGSLSAAYISYQPHQITQPDGKTINCFCSGDEFFNFIHDENGYSIIQGHKDAWYYYAIKDNEKIVPSKYRVGTVNPMDINELKPWTKISKIEYQKRKEEFLNHGNLKINTPKVNATGTFNNIVIYIRFAGESEIQTTRNNYDITMNNISTSSLKSYYNEVSYGNLLINSTHYPSCSNPLNTNASYIDSHPRSYFQPYNETNNIDGYIDSHDRGEREEQLLVDAVTWINANSPIPNSINIDNDNDGKVDNVCFMIKGSSGEWADLLWAHRWWFNSQFVYINGKRVFDYTFQPENQVNWTTLCHEMFHAIGAPDLYHYQDQGVLTSAGYWDIMEYGDGHMGAYMKWKYSNHLWINSIPEITTSGQYWIRPLTSSAKNCYKIASPNSTSEFFIVEYREKIAGTYENNLPASGMLVYRINSLLTGNSNGPPDEVYIYRPFGDSTNNGNVDNAVFSQNSNRIYINDFSNPPSLLTNGSNGGLDIFNISQIGDSISFNINIGNTAQYQATVNSNNTLWGTVSGSGTFNANNSVTVQATPANGYRFVKWSEGAVSRSLNPQYTFPINHNMILTAMFAPLDSICEGGNQLGSTKVATTNWQFINNLYGGLNVNFFVSEGVTYTWSLCPTDGGMTNYDSQLSIFKYDNDSLVAFNDDGCGSYGTAKIVWTSFFTGKVKVKISEFSCLSNQLQTTLAFKSNIDPPTCDISVTADPVASATVTGGGQYNFGQQVILRTIPNSSWNFLGWFENDILVHSAFTYVLTADVSKNLVAKYTLDNGVKNIDSQNLNIFFNPNSSSIEFVGDIKNQSTIFIYDVTGRLIESTQIPNGFTTLSIPITHLNNGVYIIEAINNQQIIRKKIRIIQ